MHYYISLLYSLRPIPISFYVFATEQNNFFSIVLNTRGNFLPSESNIDLSLFPSCLNHVMAA
ncbi:unnamed protein product [Brassica rapa]|uniref:Uncharacterized protein n=1 Tax=Brassica campestris TaxID=3711 RepID=A0A8D9I8J4_BRACM|nr:unnamed protein product [Brassica rapa]